MFNSPLFTVFPKAKTIPIPPNDTLGPIPISIPSEFLKPTIELIDGKNFPCSIPPITTTHSTKPVMLDPLANLLSHCHPY